ncbi:hypothetical protein L3Q82_018577, partial [Scortum barcoo]
MPSVGLEILGVTLSILGWILAVVSCALPMWRVSAFIGMNIVTAQITWEGIWMSCVVQSTGQMQCKIYDSMLALSADLQAARALTIISIVVGVVGLLVAIMGAKCTNCVEEESAKAKVMIAAGVAFILASLTQLIPVSWSAHSIIMEFYNPIIPEAQKREIGTALYLGWAAAAFLLIGGGILCSSCPPEPEKRYGAPPKIMYSQTSRRGRRSSMSVGLELIGISLCILGWIIAIVACALPMWRVTAFIGSNIVTAQIIWEGLWMTCVVQSTGQMQCKVYDSMLALSQDLQAARALTVISILLAILAVLIAIAGAKCTNCIDDEGVQGQGDDHLRGLLHRFGGHAAHPRLLVGQHHNQGFLQPSTHRRPAEGAGNAWRCTSAGRLRRSWFLVAGCCAAPVHHA